jgi:hypothetical protein
LVAGAKAEVPAIVARMMAAENFIVKGCCVVGFVVKVESVVSFVVDDQVVRGLLKSDGCEKIR